MLTKPDVEDSAIITCLRDQYGIPVAQLAFLPLGADRNTAVYRAQTEDADYFLKLRSGFFDELTLTVPKLLHDQGVTQVIAPIPTQSGALWTPLGDFKLAIFPFVEGRDAYDLAMTDAHWIEFGRALSAIHSAQMPPSVTDHVAHESYSDRWREIVKRFMGMIRETSFDDPIAAELARFLWRQRDLIDALLQRAGDLAAVLRARDLPLILCHADIHAGNLLITPDDRVFIVDWDTLILAPKERDLMYVGGGLFGGKRAPQAEEAFFYRGYGTPKIDPSALIFYRYERIVEDIAAYCEEILLAEVGGQDRENGLRQLMSQFRPGAVIDVAFRSEQSLLL